ncbi:DUF4388 domain-containing protein [Haliangium sp.]|uniref:DUF4388 domain-containing protein n=1 Tax=Haliangium sp. TaxID=2663208 RepID=UPI003D122CBA
MCTEARVAEAVRFGFEREGARVCTLADAEAVAAQLGGDGDDSLDGAWPDLIVAGAGDSEQALELLATLRNALARAATSAAAAGRAVPILCLGPADLQRPAARAAGANELVREPAFVRDLVTMGRLMVTGARADISHTIEGQLSDFGGVFPLIRAMAAIEHTGVLSMVRGLRRGELRFHHGEITSAQVGGLHGLAAVHQLLLWSRAHFELRRQEVVPRRQIPLSANDVLTDAERFLHEMRSVLGALMPAGVYELVDEVVVPYEDLVPTPVSKVMLLCDGYRTMADVVEDSPYRVLETLRIANRLAEMGWIRVVDDDREDDRPVEERLAHAYAEVSSASIGTVELQTITGREATPPVGVERLRLRADSELDDEDDAPTPAPLDIDWSDVLPIEMSSGFSPVVPATAASGEIMMPEGLPLHDDGLGDDVDIGELDTGKMPVLPPAGTAAPRPAPSSDSRPAVTVSTSQPPPARAQPDDPPGDDGAVELAQPPRADSDRDGSKPLWRRIFGRTSPKPAPADDEPEPETPKPGGKRAGRSRSRRG